MNTIDMTIRELLFWIVLGGSIGGVTVVSPGLNHQGEEIEDSVPRAPTVEPI